ncbi:ly6/PLAUR domain-containing protein 8 [Austrofundulus limnaeus]|uniref:Ly6/PLAUR domain-containing protein 8 n=1 Tax=Austrofundulus limnaeus TaxID=52670 RepID=A0A2I4CZA7_AUSLI|nr:PREDICTED: ly6/PLAUR domain-containing protein 8-like [Austrofundulus limnaeus]
MFFFPLIVGIWNLQKVHTLQCLECTPDTFGSCTETTKECPSQYHQCASARLVMFLEGTKFPGIDAKSCALAEVCVDGSFNFGATKGVYKTKCCSGELCNNYTVSDSDSTPNGKKCFSCVGQDCNRTLNCEGNEDHCIKATMNVGGNSQTMKGCASELVCSDKLSTVLNQFKGLELNSGIECCQGDYCNSAIKTSASLPLLLVPLSYVVWFY